MSDYISSGMIGDMIRQSVKARLVQVNLAQGKSWSLDDFRTTQEGEIVFDFSSIVSGIDPVYCRVYVDIASLLSGKGIDALVAEAVSPLRASTLEG